jgi:hypothetical protein
VDQPDIAPALERASLSELLQLQDGYDSGAKSLKAKLDTVKAEIARRFAESAKQTLAQKGKTHGSGKLELQDRMAVKYDVKQEVKWDSDALMAVAQTLPWSRVQQLFKIDFSMSETIYKGLAAIAPEDLMAKIDDARTTKIKEPSLTLVKED